MPSRRQILGLIAAGTVGPIAGCVTPGGALGMTAVETDAAVGEAGTVDSDSIHNEDDVELLERAITEETTEVDGEWPPLKLLRPVRWGGAVYEVTWESVGEQTRSEHVVVVEQTDEDAEGARIEYEELPAVDRDRLSDLRPEEHGDERIGWEFEYADEDAVADSVLVPETEYGIVVVDGTPFTIENTERERTVHTYEYDATELAPSTAAYGAELRAEHLFELQSLTGEERELVEEAIQEGQAVVGTNDDAFVGVGEKLLDREPIYVHHETGEWLVEYEGTTYWTELDAVRTRELAEKLEAYDDAE